jgi:hypothetical protein
MKQDLRVIVNLGLLLQRIRDKDCHGFSDAAALCRTSPKNFQRLARGELPRLDAVQRICLGLGLSESQLIVGTVKTKATEPGEVVELAAKRRL